MAGVHSYLKLAALVAVLLIVAAGPASAQEVRIVGIDGVLDPSGGSGKVNVRPGQVVSLTADEVWRANNGSLEYAYRPVEDFVWSTGELGGDSCDPETGCAADSRFEVTEYGINFTVPWDAPPRISIKASLKWGSASDTVLLVNKRAAANGRPYWDRYLDGLGRWVVLNGTSVFVPGRYTDGWAPYNHGYWYWTSYGWTWYSYDPWGYVTDHCGHWRHSIVWGWVWIPELVCTWRPAVVTFFYGPNWIGWYPWDPGWRHGYRHGYADGYNDGYWTGRWVGHRTGRRGRLGTHPGLVMVSDKNFYVPGKGHKGPPGRKFKFPPNHGSNMAMVMSADPIATNAVFMDAVKKGHFGPVPGGGKDPAKGRDFIARRTGREPVEVQMRPAWNDGAGKEGRGSWREPASGKRSVPEKYREATKRVMRESARGTRSGNRASVKGKSTSRGGRSSAPAARPTSRRGTIERTAWKPRTRAAGEDPAKSRKVYRTKTPRRSDRRSSGGDIRTGRSGRTYQDHDNGRAGSSDGRRTGGSDRGKTRVPDRWKLPPQDKPDPVRDRPQARPDKRKKARPDRSRKAVSKPAGESRRYREVRKTGRPKAVRSGSSGRRSAPKAAPSYRPSRGSSSSGDSGRSSYRPKKSKKSFGSASPSRSRPSRGSFQRPPRSSGGRSRTR